MIYLPGGPSHMDMYDLKPDAPAEFRGEFKPIADQRPRRADLRALPAAGQDVGQARRVRSLVSVDEHSDSLVMTGYSEQRQPHRRPPVVRLGGLEAARRRPTATCRRSSACAA